MQLIIPMSGLGSRFIEAGYKDPKPLIKVGSKPIIEWVLRMFPGEDKPIFICRDEHLQETNMQAQLKYLAPKGKVLGIEGHKKGPVYAVAQIFDFIEDNEPVLVSYCDYYMRWNYRQFKEQVEKRGCEGAVPCYTGFHPNLLPEKNFYASCKIDKEENLIEIREKFSWEKDKQKALHSPGVYYLKSGKIMKYYFQKMLDNNISLNGEYYVSMVYNLLVEDGLKVWCPANIKYFCQWGTPEDLKEYLFWMNIVQGFKK